MMIYTIGLIFSADLRTVYLIRKKSPAWQAGLLNGAGGKREHGETFLSCMDREAQEEAGYKGEWTPFAYMHGEHSAHGDPVWQCQVFYSVMEPHAEEPHTCEAEEIEAHPVENIPALVPQMMPHIPWLVFSALHHMSASKKFSMDISY
ncbi:hypothetical protein FACS1894168_3350 [Deltaproteobacteria bacterium]|nr:hypothetical protein FACS1894168_3350 [Deltaproteobacteria bacterium]